MSGAFKIRNAIAADADQIHELHTRSVRELCKGHYTPEQINEWLRNRSPDRYLPGIERNEMFVAVEGTMIVGFGHAVPGEVWAIYVSPAYIRKGVGTLLLRHGISMAQRGSQRIIRLDSTLNAREFYEKVGFIETGRKSIRRNNALLPVVCMELPQKT
jgi:ribosomal protein S18 acetylase RimI-like enzyme